LEPLEPLDLSMRYDPHDAVSMAIIVADSTILVSTARLPDNLIFTRVGRSCCEFLLARKSHVER